MPKLPQISGRELTKVFLKDGWFHVSTRGSHLKLRKQLKPIGQATINYSPTQNYKERHIIRNP